MHSEIRQISEWIITFVQLYIYFVYFNKSSKDFNFSISKNYPKVHLWKDIYETSKVPFGK